MKHNVLYDLIVAVMNITISTQHCLPDFHMIWSSTDVVYECLRDSFEEKRALLHHLQIIIKKDDGNVFVISGLQMTAGRWTTSGQK